MLNDLEATIQHIIISTSNDMAKQIATAVRQALAAEIIGLPAAPAKRGPGRPRKAQKAAAVGAPKASAAAPAPKPKKLARRSSKRVAKDDAAILAFVTANGGLRSVELQKQIKMPAQNLASGLKRLREAGKIKMKGVKAAATYAAA